MKSANVRACSSSPQSQRAAGGHEPDGACIHLGCAAIYNYRRECRSPPLCGVAFADAGLDPRSSSGDTTTFLSLRRRVGRGAMRPLIRRGVNSPARERGRKAWFTTHRRNRRRPWSTWSPNRAHHHAGLQHGAPAAQPPHRCRGRRSCTLSYRGLRGAARGALA